MPPFLPAVINFQMQRPRAELFVAEVSAGQPLPPSLRPSRTPGAAAEPRGTRASPAGPARPLRSAPLYSALLTLPAHASAGPLLPPAAPAASRAAPAQAARARSEGPSCSRGAMVRSEPAAGRARAGSAAPAPCRCAARCLCPGSHSVCACVCMRARPGGGGFARAPAPPPPPRSSPGERQQWEGAESPPAACLPSLPGIAAGVAAAFLQVKGVKPVPGPIPIFVPWCGATFLIHSVHCKEDQS